MVDRVPRGAHTLVDRVTSRAHPFVNRVAGSADAVMDRVAELVNILANGATVAKVQIVDFAFNPGSVSIHTGDTIHWVWKGDMHSTTSVAGR